MVKTRLQVAANLNYDVFSKYLTWLEEKGLVAVSTGDGVPSRVEITEKGREAYRRLVSWLDDFVRRQPL